MNVLAKHYGKLTPEERFRLIQAAHDRGDEAEVDRVTQAGERIPHRQTWCDGRQHHQSRAVRG